MAAEVILLQHYHSESSSAFEAKFVFPLDEFSAVSGFEAFINSKHVVGVVKERAKARKEYRQAIQAGTPFISLPRM